jgi:putative two-component system response regulator
MESEHPQSTVMVVDDTPGNLKFLGQVLHSAGYRVVQFPNGQMALQAAARNPPDLILLDIMMPGMDGFEVCQKIKLDASLQDIPVIFISALDDTESKLMAFSQGGVDYVTKPFQAEEVLARVKTHLSLKWMQGELKRYTNYLERLVQEKVHEIADSQLATILAVSQLAEFRDDETGRHIERTRTFCKLLARQLQSSNQDDGIQDSFIQNIYHASPLHDIGKVGVADSILLKPGKLTSEEFEIIKTHTIIGARTLERVRERYPQNAFVNMGITLTRSHHEKWDGSGYPDGLSGEDIPLSGRIMALADVYDALRSKRPYKEPFSHAQSLKIIKKDTGSHFDPAVVKAFLALEPEFAEIRDRMDDNDDNFLFFESNM